MNVFELLTFSCQKFIFQRNDASLADGVRRSALVSDSATLSAAQIAAIRGADTCFVASAAAGGADASHRGGRAGFVRVSGGGRRLSLASYPGNGIFNTEGNVLAEGRAGALFVDWRSGRTIQVSGRAAIDFLEPGGARQMDGCERIIDIDIERVVEIERKLSEPLAMGN